MLVVIKHQVLFLDLWLGIPRAALGRPSRLLFTGMDIFSLSQSKAAQSTPYSFKVQDIKAYLNVSYVFMTWCLIKHRSNLALPYTKWRKKKGLTRIPMCKHEFMERKLKHLTEEY
jgi:hypothetical protein